MQSSCKSGLIIESQHIHHVLSASQVFQLTLVLLVNRSSNKKDLASIFWCAIHLLTVPLQLFASKFDELASYCRNVANQGLI